jgi:subtilisin family serine protease
VMKDFRTISRMIVAIAFSSFILSSTPSTQIAGQTQDNFSLSEQQYKAGTVLVRFKTQYNPQAIQNAVDGLKVAQTGTVFGSDVIILQVPDGKEQEIISRLSAHPDVLFAELDYRYEIAMSPDDPYFGAQWAHTTLRSSEAWDITTGDAAIRIAIIDTGIDATHPDLASKILPGHSFLNQVYQDSNPVDLHGHGTHVAGIAAAVTDNNAGVAGTSWGARIIPVRVLDSNGDGWTTDIAAGINWARTQNAHIINLSLGGEAQSLTMQSAIQQAYDAGILVIASMGSVNAGTPFYPAAYPHVLAVTATDRNNQRAPYSNYGSHADIAAPGGYMTSQHDSNGIFSTLPTYAVHLTTQEGYSTWYDTLHGTSQAAPFVSGLASLILSLEPGLSPDDVTDVITSTAVDLGDPGWDQYYGHGLADARAALDNINALAFAPIIHEIANGDQDGDYVVQWEPVDRADMYHLEIAGDPGFLSTTLVHSGPETQFTVTGQPAGTWYHRVKASNASGDSPWSLSVETGVLPDAPVLMPVSDGSQPDAYSLSWTTVTGAASYMLQESGDLLFTNPITSYKGSDTQHSITGQAGGDWYYRVSALSTVGQSAWSNIQSKTVPATSLTAPELLIIDNSDGDSAYTVQWTAVPSTTIYALEVSQSSYFHTKSIAYIGPKTELFVNNQPEGTWYYRVRGYSPSTYSPWSEIQKAVVISEIYTPIILRQYTAPAPTSYLSNGNFEAGDTGWFQYSLRGYPLIVDRTYAGMKTPYEGDWAVWMGGDYGEIAYIQQEVLIYSSNPYLTFWHWIESEETGCNVDNVEIMVNTASVETFGLCLAHNTGGWIQHNVDLSAYVGGKATLVVRVATDYTLNSNYFIDEVAFNESPVMTLSSLRTVEQQTAPTMKR